MARFLSVFIEYVDYWRCKLSLIKVGDKEVGLIVYKEQPVITAKMIADVHGKEIKVINQQFKRNKIHFVENVDFFIVNKQLVTNCDQSNLSKSQIAIQELFIQNPSSEVYLFTESGYLMLTKTFRDKTSWEVQRMLVNNYFKFKEVVKKVESEPTAEDVVLGSLLAEKVFDSMIRTLTPRKPYKRKKYIQINRQEVTKHFEELETSLVQSLNTIGKLREMFKM